MAHKTTHSNGQEMAKNNKMKRHGHAHGHEMAKNEMMKGLLWMQQRTMKIDNVIKRETARDSDNEGMDEQNTTNEMMMT